ncbi:hypothetical protein OJF2_33730 [Aquisphaera giovannonii]|uniref:Uncharacterized protein n=1 Tax=Aquisphaera giovannonii TaxID=406548 RepID=A0A5B9W2M4_9BACT|nr:hypothetical protein [Aquisphaera giovannonii]QEH34828.1 hypothetical protein OJF2_33730 [Aquisphaera giovannonii]
MRRLVTTLLTGLLLACPLLCGGDEIGHGAQHESAPGDAGGKHAPCQCPDGDDNCICRGAVEANAARTNALLDSADARPLFVPASQPWLAPPAHHLTPEGSTTGLASLGESLTIRAYLQNFRF